MAYIIRSRSGWLVPMLEEEGGSMSYRTVCPVRSAALHGEMEGGSAHGSAVVGSIRWNQLLLLLILSMLEN